MDEHFYHLQHFPALPSHFLTLAQNADYLAPESHKSFTNLILSRFSTENSTDELSTSRFLKDLKEKFPTTMNPVFIKIAPKSLYDWHIDRNDVTTGINILLSDGTNSYTLFKTPGGVNNYYKVSRCDYTQFIPTVFNSTVSHCVINLDDNDRYLIRIPVKSVPYKVLKDYLTNYKFVSYIP